MSLVTRPARLGLHLNLNAVSYGESKLARTLA